MEWRKDNYLISDDRTRMDIGAIHALLDATYWAAGRSLAAVEKSVANSLCFGLFHEQKQVGFARVVTDGAVFAWLCDVVLEQSHRNRGVGSWMMEAVLEHPALQSTEIVLRTNGSESLYARRGFSPCDSRLTWMNLKR